MVGYIATKIPQDYKLDIKDLIDTTVWLVSLTNQIYQSCSSTFFTLDTTRIVFNVM